eukprot:SAG31_NODE_3251_length_4490_cov_2.556821_3_plen_45_part_00
MAVVDTDPEDPEKRGRLRRLALRAGNHYIVSTVAPATRYVLQAF